jgi:hypothetical protein
MDSFILEVLSAKVMKAHWEVFNEQKLNVEDLYIGYILSTKVETDKKMLEQGMFYPQIDFYSNCAVLRKVTDQIYINLEDEKNSIICTQNPTYTILAMEPLIHYHNSGKNIYGEEAVRIGRSYYNDFYENYFHNKPKNNLQKKVKVRSVGFNS